MSALHLRTAHVPTRPENTRQGDEAKCGPSAMLSRMNLTDALALQRMPPQRECWEQSGLTLVLSSWLQLSRQDVNTAYMICLPQVINGFSIPSNRSLNKPSPSPSYMSPYPRKCGGAPMTPISSLKDSKASLYSHHVFSSRCH